jgi:hypothetical protein
MGILVDTYGVLLFVAPPMEKSAGTHHVASPMLDLPRLKRIRLMKRPIGQVFFGHTVLAPNYNFFPGIDIQLEGASTR